MSRTLAQVVRRHVSNEVFRKGESYYLQGRVLRLLASRTEYAATVRGSEAYDVSLDIYGTSLVVYCSCPYFSDRREVCKHIWAATHAADHAGKLVVPADLELVIESPDEWLDQDETQARVGSTHPSASGTSLRHQRPPEPAPWERFLALVTPLPTEVLPARALLTGELIYVFDPARSRQAGGVLIELMTRERKKSGDWGKPRATSITRGDIAKIPDARDRRILHALCGADVAYAYGGSVWGGQAATMPVPSAAMLNATQQRELVPRLCETGRLLLRYSQPDAGPQESFVPIAWEPQPAAFDLRITAEADGGHQIDGIIRRGDRSCSLREPRFVTSHLILWQDSGAAAGAAFASFDPGGAEAWLGQLFEQGPVSVPAGATASLVALLTMADLPRVDAPPALRLVIAQAAPQPFVRIARPHTPAYGRYHADLVPLEVALSFVYGEGAAATETEAWSGPSVIVGGDRTTAWRRDRDAERTALGRLQSLGVRRVNDWTGKGTRMEVAANAVPTLVRQLLADHWRVEADGRLYRTAVSTTLDVRSGIDWFELHGAVDFGGIRADLPALLAAAGRGDPFVPLGDGTFGLLPEDWLARGGRIAALGTPDTDHVRFAPSQAALLDAWLETQPQVSCDQAFARARTEITTFTGVAPAEPPLTFTGSLRPYQRDALGWFAFLRRFGFGGCLADEMGLGKTVMVLAVLEDRRLERQQAGHPMLPSVIVVPRSLVFNWRQEAGRFTPALRVLDFTGADRRGAIERIHEHDVILTTYGTLRRDVGHLKEVAFDYVILDESQTVKNARTSGAKAVRLLQGQHRLALSGTPVENRLSELWSLFEFLNPGMLGGLSTFTGTTRSHAPDEESLRLIARGLRPFILRRTKEQVAKELPPRTEQTLYCDLEPPQRALYDELRDHYRSSLLGRIATVGIGRAKIHVLEALLRLRQAACHPALVDPGRAGEPSAKLDLLLPRLQELVEDGRKAIVFSQFTSLLDLLRLRLDEAGLNYEYLDGRTRDRAARVARFQESGCPLFLVSLKAGGVGLNLTAAEYVFLLDPWWNPAVEAQAVDRAHRIGQTKPVFAFRVIARDTVEEKVLELQGRKRALAEAIVRADEGLLRDLKKEDLELLLS